MIDQRILSSFLSHTTFKCTVTSRVSRVPRYVQSQASWRIARGRLLVCAAMSLLAGAELPGAVREMKTFIKKLFILSTYYCFQTRDDAMPESIKMCEWLFIGTFTENNIQNCEEHNSSFKLASWNII
jgi:hypothetical protein